MCYSGDAINPVAMQKELLQFQAVSQAFNPALWDESSITISKTQIVEEAEIL